MVGQSFEVASQPADQFRRHRGCTQFVQDFPKDPVFDFSLHYRAVIDHLRDRRGLDVVITVEDQQDILQCAVAPQRGICPHPFRRACRLPAEKLRGRQFKIMPDIPEDQRPARP